MRSGRIFFYLALILILGLVGVVVVYQKVLKPAPAPQASVTSTPAPEEEMVNVVVVSQQVPRGTLINESVLSMVPVQKDLLMNGMYTNVNEALGRQARFDLESGLPLTSAMLVDPGEQVLGAGSTASLSIPTGMVAVSIPIDKLASVSYGLRPGDHVNIIVSMAFVDLDTDFQTRLPNFTGSVLAPGPGGEGTPASLTAKTEGGIGGSGVQGRAEIDPVLGQTLYILPSEVQRPRQVAQNLIQDAIVLHVGDFPIKDPKPTPAPAADPAANAAGGTNAVTASNQPVLPEEPAQQEAPPPPPEVATLIVSPQDAVTLSYLIESGARLTLAMRAAGDSSRIQTEAVTLQFILDQYDIRIPVKLPYGMEIQQVNEVPAP
jgi:pilus assembly protein CpaB